ncbi:MAG: hypothetical protein NXI20_17030 [bacterium]|nr:hypothetical protein [bacterium]
MLKKAFLTFLGLFVILILLILFQSVDPVQVDRKTTSFIFADTLESKTYNKDSLIQLVGTNKGLPEGYEMAALLAFAAYPELKEVNIDMELTQSGAPMESNFDIGTLFGPKKNRVYKILLNDATNAQFDEILLRSLPFDAQVGILAHELGHVAYYDELSTLQIAKWGLMYLVSSEFRAKHERSTDLMPVYHGLGSQIYQYAYYVRYDPSCRDLYEQFGAEFIDKYYMTDVELKELL